MFTVDTARRRPAGPGAYVRVVPKAEPNAEARRVEVPVGTPMPDGDNPVTRVHLYDRLESLAPAGHFVVAYSYGTPKPFGDRAATLAPPVEYSRRVDPPPAAPAPDVEEQSPSASPLTEEVAYYYAGAVVDRYVVGEGAFVELKSGRGQPRQLRAFPPGTVFPVSSRMSKTARSRSTQRVGAALLGPGETALGFYVGRDATAYDEEGRRVSFEKTPTNPAPSRAEMARPGPFLGKVVRR